MKIHCLQHIAYSGRAYLPEWAARMGHSWEATLIPETGKLPRVDDFDALIVVGGPMSVWQDKLFPWLTSEKRFLEQVVGLGIPVLGICLGAQLLAELLGGKAYKGAHKEIGWYPAEATDNGRDTWLGDALPDRFETFFWHGDTFDLPHGAIRIARSAAFDNAGFIWRQTIGLQFHLEVTQEWVRKLAARDVHELVAALHIQTAEEILGKDEPVFRDNNALMDALLERWLSAANR